MTVTHPPPVRLEPVARHTLERALAEGALVREEPCGYLLGTLRAGCFRVKRVLVGKNTHETPERAFRLSADEHLATRRRAARDGLTLLGIWHGHPRGAARPSAADRAGMTPPHAVLRRRTPRLMLIAQAPEEGKAPVLAAFVCVAVLEGEVGTRWIEVGVER